MSMDEEISQCIERGLLKYGKTVTNVIFWHCNFSSSIEKWDVPSNPELFEKELKVLFGSSSDVMIKSIVNNLEDHFDLIEDSPKSLREAINLIKEKYSGTVSEK